MNTSVGNAGNSVWVKTVLPPFWNGTYSKRKEFKNKKTNLEYRKAKMRSLIANIQAPLNVSCVRQRAGDFSSK